MIWFGCRWNFLFVLFFIQFFSKFWFSLFWFSCIPSFNFLYYVWNWSKSLVCWKQYYCSSLVQTLRLRLWLGFGPSYVLAFRHLGLYIFKSIYPKYCTIRTIHRESGPISGSFKLTNNQDQLLWMSTKCFLRSTFVVVLKVQVSHFILWSAFSCIFSPNMFLASKLQVYFSDSIFLTSF